MAKSDPKLVELLGLLALRDNSLPIRHAARGPFAGLKGVRKFRDILDGTSNTAAFGERVISPGRSWRNVPGGLATRVAGMDANPTNCLARVGANGELTGSVYNGGTTGQNGAGRPWNQARPAQTGFTTVLPPNGPSCSSGGNNNQWGIFPPSSHHPGGVNITMCDGSVNFISETIDTGNLSAASIPPTRNNPSPYGVWGALGSIAGGEVSGP